MAQLRDLLVNGASRFLGVVNFNNEAIFNEGVTLNETLTLLKSTEANGNAYNSPALVIGNKTAGHLEFDGNEIMSKASETTTASLHLNHDGGQVVIGPGGMSTTGVVTVGSGNAATSSTAGELIVNGGIAVSKASIFGNKITSDTLTLTNTSATSHITFSRGNFNYITAPKNGVIAFVVNGQAVGDVNSEFIIKDGEIRPGTTNVTTLGASSYRWSTIYGVNLNLSGNATIGDATTDAHTIKGKVTLTGEFLPGANATYSLGASDAKWKKLYVGDGTAGAVSNTGAQSGSIIVNGGMSLTHDIAIKCGDSDKAIKFVYGTSSNNGYGWQIKYSGSGDGDANYFSIDSAGTSGTYSSALRFGLTSLDGAFGGNIYPLTAFGKNVGSTSNPWATVYAKSHKIYNANKSDAGGIYVQTDGTTSKQGESCVVVGNSTASGKAGNSRGSIFLYSTNTGYTRLIPGTNNTSNYTLYLPGATGQLVYHTNDTKIGGSLIPVYVDSGGKVTACTVSADGDRWGVLTSVGSNGVMEVGKYINFHNTNGDTTDYSYRITTDTSLLTGSGGIKAATTMESGTTMTVGTNLTVKSNAYFANGTTYKIDSSGHAVFNNTTAKGNLTVSGTATIAKDTTIGNGTASTSMTTGALKVAGGIGATGQVNAKTIRVDNSVYFQYNSTDKCLDIIFG